MTVVKNFEPIKGKIYRWIMFNEAVDKDGNCIKCGKKPAGYTTPFLIEKRWKTVSIIPHCCHNHNVRVNIETRKA